MRSRTSVFFVTLAMATAGTSGKAVALFDTVLDRVGFAQKFEAKVSASPCITARGGHQGERGQSSPGGTHLGELLVFFCLLRFASTLLLRRVSVRNMPLASLFLVSAGRRGDGRGQPQGLPKRLS